MSNAGPLRMSDRIEPQNAPVQDLTARGVGEAYPESLPAARLLPPQAIQTTQGIERSRIASTGTPEQQQGLMTNDLRATYGDAIADQLTDGPAAERLRASHEPDTTRHGFKDKLLHVLSGAGKGFLLGGLGGAAVGAISPGTADRAVYRGIERPRLEADAQRERGMQAQRLSELGNAANLTGQLPDGSPTEQRRYRMESEATRRQNQANIDADRDARLDETRRQHDRTNDYRSARLEQFNRQIQNGRVIQVKGANGTYLVDKDDPESAALITDKDGKPIPSLEAALEAGRQHRADVQASLRAQGMEQNESQFQRRETSTESRFGRSQEGMNQRAAARGKGRRGFFDPPVAATPQATAPAGKTIKRGEYDAIVNKIGKDKADAGLKARGLTIIE